MTIDDFKATLAAATPPPVPPLLLALWHDARGDWDEAHRIAQDIDDQGGAWVHAYLHRKEGDPGTQATGTAVRGNRPRPIRSRRSGGGS